MNAIELIHQEIRSLPSDKTQEVLDFILFIKSRPENKQWQNLMAAQQQPLSHVWDNVEDEVWNEL